MPYITTNTITTKCIHHIAGRVEYSDEYIVAPLTFATLWKDITGRTTVTDADIENIKALANFFQSGLAITRNNRND